MSVPATFLSGTPTSKTLRPSSIRRRGTSASSPRVARPGLRLSLGELRLYPLEDSRLDAKGGGLVCERACSQGRDLGDLKAAVEAEKGVEVVE